jgi:hypothetical protein
MKYWVWIETTALHRTFLKTIKVMINKEIEERYEKPDKPTAFRVARKPVIHQKGGDERWYQ